MQYELAEVKTGFILENKGMREVKRHNFGFSPLIFPSLGHLERYTPLNSMYFRAAKISFAGARKPVLIKASSGKRCAPRNFVQLVTLRDTHVRLIVYLVVHQMKYVMEK